MGRSIAAIAMGFAFIVILSFGADALLLQMMPDVFDAGGRVTSTPILILILGYVAVFAVAGCYLAARLAPARPMKHALILGGLGLVFSIAGMAASWASAPAWYHITALVMVMPYAWVGGWLEERHRARA
jgi:hypothetical protein